MVVGVSVGGAVAGAVGVAMVVGVSVGGAVAGAVGVAMVVGVLITPDVYVGVELLTAVVVLVAMDIYGVVGVRVGIGVPIDVSGGTVGTTVLVGGGGLVDGCDVALVADGVGIGAAVAGGRRVAVGGTGTLAVARTVVMVGCWAVGDADIVGVGALGVGVADGRWSTIVPDGIAGVDGRVSMGVCALTAGAATLVLGDPRSRESPSGASAWGSGGKSMGTRPPTLGAGVTLRTTSSRATSATIAGSSGWPTSPAAGQGA
jgi:hypothetical protein